MKLIKLNTDHYVIVDDSEIKVGDWIVNINGYWKGKIAQSTGEVMDCWKKITHSTQPLDERGYWGKVMPLTLTISEIKELIGEVDVEKKVRNEMGIPDYLPTNSMSPSMQGSLEFGIKCYNQALEDNKEKKYTNEDMLTIRNQLVTMLPVGDVAAWDMIQAVSKYTKWFDEYIQSLQPKTEWEVEFIDGKLTLKNQTK